MSLYKRYATNKQAETDGVKITMEDGEFFVIASSESDRVRDLDSRWTKKNRQAILQNGGLLTPKLQDDKDLFLMVEGILRGWGTDVMKEDGTYSHSTDMIRVGENDVPTKYTKDAAKKVLTELRELRAELMYLARMGETFRASELATAVGNSAEPSAPISAPVAPAS